MWIITDSTTVDIEYGKWDWRLRDKDPNQEWETKPAIVGIAIDEDEPEYKIFGLMSYGQMSHMSYRIKDLKPMEDLKQPVFYFDAGGNGRPTRIKVDQLEKAYRALGLIKDE